MPLDVTFPPARARPVEAAPLVSEKYERYETITGTPGDAGTFSDLGNFSGTPDAIDLIGASVDVLVQLTDPELREESTYLVLANQTVHTHIARRKIRAQRAAGAGAVTLRAVGKWASRGDGG